jgi:hypothetical protein
MQLATGTVIDGKVDEETVRLSPADEAELLEALDEADLEEGISAEELFSRLQRFG